MGVKQMVKHSFFSIFRKKWRCSCLFNSLFRHKSEDKQIMTHCSAEDNNGRQLGCLQCRRWVLSLLYADKEVDFYSEFLSALSPSYISHLLSDVHSHIGVRKVTSRGFQRWCKIGFGLLKIAPFILI